jgi:hypothetical protein
VHRPRVTPARIGADAIGDAIGLDLDVAVEVGPIRGEAATRAKRRERLRGGMAVIVVDSDRDDGDRRSERVEQLSRRRGARPVMPDLEDVDRRKRVSGKQRRLDRCLGVTREKRREAAVLQHKDD